MEMPVELHVEGPVATLTLNDPTTRNALGRENAKALLQHLRSAENQPEVRALVITGAGASFCSGADLRDQRVHRPAGLTERNPAQQTQLFDIIAGCSKPTVAAISGPAVGAGANLALACDLRVCAENAWLQWPQVGMGIMPGSGTLARLSHVVGSARALDWVVTGRRVGAQEGLAAGLHARVVPASDLMSEAQGVAGVIAAHPTSSVRFVREGVASLVKRDVAFTADADNYRAYILYSLRERGQDPNEPPDGGTEEEPIR